MVLQGNAYLTLLPQNAHEITQRPTLYGLSVEISNL